MTHLVQEYFPVLSVSGSGEIIEKGVKNGYGHKVQWKLVFSLLHISSII